MEIFFKWLYIVTFLLVMPLLFHGVKHSSYYVIDEVLRGSHIHNELKIENDARKVEAHRFLSALGETGRRGLRNTPEKADNDKPNISLTIVGLSRDKLGKSDHNYRPEYLTQAVWKWLRVLKEAEETDFPYNMNLSVCNVDNDPSGFLEAVELARYVHVFNRFNTTVKDSLPRLEKEKQDYVYCLNKSLENKPKYVFLLEDDALPRNETLPLLQFAMKTLVERTYSRGEIVENTDRIAWIKFYHPDWEGFMQLHLHRILELLSIGAVFGTIFALLYEKYMGHVPIYKIWMFFIVYAMLLALGAGRENIMQFRRLLFPHLYGVVPSLGCCTQAILYTYDGGSNVIDYLSSTHDGLPKDLSLYEFLYKSIFKAYYIQPNVFEHIGLYSMVREKADITRV